jgi:hypothetical protein
MYQIIDQQFEQRRQQIDSGSNFVIGVGTVFGQPYHTIEPIINWIEIHKWCVELFGTEDSIWDNYNGRWYINDRRIWFRDESDLLVFILRWK